jgi:Putative DNA-binding domain
MSALARQQQALLAALFDWPPQTASTAMAGYLSQPWERGLRVYQANGHALAVRALGASYPVLAQLMGQDSFAALARAFWHECPPVRGDVGQWGEALPAFLTHNPQLQEEPYLPDLARVEWALHLCARAADAQADLPSFKLLMECEPAELTLVLAPGCALVHSNWPVVSMWSAHQMVESDFSELRQQLNVGRSEVALVWREGFRPRVREALPGEAELIASLSLGQALNQALDAAPALDFNAWLPMAVQTGLLLAARVLQRVGDQHALL